MQIGEIEARFMGELLSAEEKFPGWPEDVIHAAAIVAEERGELLKAAIDFCFGRGTRDGLIKEATQVGAMAIRFLMHVEDYQPLEEAAEPTAMETRSKYLRKKYNMEPLENRIVDINAKQHGSIQITGLNPEGKKNKKPQPETCGECVHFEGNNQENYCPWKMTATSAESGGCGEGERFEIVEATINPEDKK